MPEDQASFVRGGAGSELTPEKALAQYMRMGPDFLNEDVEARHALTVQQQLDLLVYQMAHLTMLVQKLIAVDAVPAAAVIPRQS